MKFATHCICGARGRSSGTLENTPTETVGVGQSVAAAAVVITAASAAVKTAEQKYDYYENDYPFTVIAAKHSV